MHITQVQNTTHPWNKYTQTTLEVRYTMLSHDLVSGGAELFHFPFLFSPPHPTFSPLPFPPFLPSGRITWDPRGPSHLKNVVAPAKHLVWEGIRGPVKGPMRSPINPWLQHIILSTDADDFCSPKCDFRGPQKKLSRLAITCHILWPLINYAIIWPL